MTTSKISLLVTSLLLLLGLSLSAEQFSGQAQVYSVKEGDTLYQISLLEYTEEERIRGASWFCIYAYNVDLGLIDILKAPIVLGPNGLSVEINVGQKLMIPHHPGLFPTPVSIVSRFGVHTSDGSLVRGFVPDPLPALPLTESVAELAIEPESEPEPAADLAMEPVPVPEPVPELVPELVPEPATVAEAVAESVATAEAKTEPAFTPEPETTPEAGMVLEPEVVAAIEPVEEPAVEPALVPVPLAETETAAEAEPALAQPETVPETVPEAGMMLGPEPVAEIQPVEEPATGAETMLVVEAEPVEESTTENARGPGLAAEAEAAPAFSPEQETAPVAEPAPVPEPTVDVGPTNGSFDWSFVGSIFSKTELLSNLGIGFYGDSLGFNAEAGIQIALGDKFEVQSWLANAIVGMSFLYDGVVRDEILVSVAGGNLRVGYFFLLSDYFPSFPGKLGFRFTPSLLAGPAYQTIERNGRFIYQGLAWHLAPACTLDVAPFKDGVLKATRIGLSFGYHYYFSTVVLQNVHAGLSTSWTF